MADERPIRFSLRRLMYYVVIASVILFLATSIIRWLNAPPQGFESSHPEHGTAEIMQVVRVCGPEELKNVRVWILAGQIFPDDYAWRATCTRRTVDCLKSIARMQAIPESRIPADFWEMPRQISTMPTWWQPKATETTEYYMTPEFVTHNYSKGDLNLCVVYDPADGTIYVRSQFNF